MDETAKVYILVAKDPWGEKEIIKVSLSQKKAEEEMADYKFMDSVRTYSIIEKELV